MSADGNKKEKNGKYPKDVRYYDSYDTDFDGRDFSARKIDGGHSYIHHSRLWKITSFLLYRVFATPFAFVYSKLVTKDKIFGKKKLRSALREGGAFLYSNHTSPVADAFAPSVMTFPKKCYVVISSKNYSLPVLGGCLDYLGALPLPTDMTAARNFAEAIKKRISEGAAVVIYPEAHVWPYCRLIRPFGSESFSYPVRFSAPAFAVTRVYKKTKFGHRSEIYIDGPFYPDENKSAKEAREELCRLVREAMLTRAELSDVEVIAYRKSV